MIDRPDENDNLLDRAARAMADAPELGGFPEQSIGSFVRAAASRDAGRPRRARRFLLRIRSTKPLFKLAASLLIAASVLAVAWAVFHAGPVLAFATVAQQLHDAQTMTADLSIQQNGLAMNGRLLFAAPGHFRVEFAGAPPEIVDMQTGRIVLIDHPHKSAIVMHISDKDAAPSPTAPPSSAPSAAESFDWIEQLRNVSRTAGQPVGEADINGIHAKEFSVTQEGQQFTIWADAKTGAPLRVQSTVKLGQDQLKVTLDRLSLGQSIDDALFSTAVPPGYSQQQATVSAAVPVESDLLTFFKNYTARTGIFPTTLKDLEKLLAPIIISAAQGNSAQFNAPAATQSLPPADLMQFLLQTGRAMLFLAQLPPSADWHYAGNDVKLNTPNPAHTPIFWYHPKDPNTWRIIYADLHTDDVAASGVPVDPSAESQAGK